MNDVNGEMALSRSSEFQKLVHFDLKGAPMLISYYEKIFPYLKQLGATGLLFEYEDMFPYEGELQIVCQPDVYSKEEIKRIHELAAENNLTLIPLVQSFGHLEFLLKHDKFYTLREVDRYPNAMCPSHPKSEEVLMDIISQMLESHKNSKYIHIGGDEVWHLGMCHRCKEKMTENDWKKEHLFLDHITRLVKRIRTVNSEIGIIVWDDMMREIGVDILKASEIGNLIMPMVWHYQPIGDFKLKDALWEKYSSVFPSIWMASAFKGASDMTQIITPLKLHLENQEAWLKVLRLFGRLFQKVEGIALTGWQRFDHYTVLCELFPVAVPCLAICLLSVCNGEYTDIIREEATALLGFETLMEIDTFPRPQPVGPPPVFPGGPLHSSCLQLANCIAEYHMLKIHPSLVGAFSNFQILHNRVNVLHIDQFLSRARVLLMNIEAINVQIEKEMKKIFYPNTVEEFYATNIQPCLEKLRKLVRDADQQVIFHSAPEDMQIS